MRRSEADRNAQISGKRRDRNGRRPVRAQNSIACKRPDGRPGENVRRVMLSRPNPKDPDRGRRRQGNTPDSRDEGGRRIFRFEPHSAEDGKRKGGARVPGIKGPPGLAAGKIRSGRIQLGARMKTRASYKKVQAVLDASDFKGRKKKRRHFPAVAFPRKKTVTFIGKGDGKGKAHPVARKVRCPIFLSGKGPVTRPKVLFIGEFRPGFHPRIANVPENGRSHSRNKKRNVHGKGRPIRSRFRKERRGRFAQNKSQNKNGDDAHRQKKIDFIYARKKLHTRTAHAEP
jgi:hypothetical protein